MIVQMMTRALFDIPKFIVYMEKLLVSLRLGKPNHSVSMPQLFVHPSPCPAELAPFPTSGKPLHRGAPENKLEDWGLGDTSAGTDPCSRGKLHRPTCS